MGISLVFIFFALLSLVSISEAYKCPKLMQTSLNPVFPPLNDDGSLNLGIIKSQYAPYLCNAGVKNLEINAAITGSQGFNIQMAMKVIQAWVDVKEQYGFQLICQVGGYTFPDVITLAEFACNAGCDGLMVLPDLYYKFNTTSQLVTYVSKVADACHNCAVGYYDAVDITGVRLNMIKFFTEASKKIQRFAGIKTSLTIAVQVAAATYLRPCQYLISYDSFTTASAYAFGLNATSSTIGNVIPRQIIQIQNAVKNNNIKRAIQIQQKINRVTQRLLNVIFQRDGTIFTYTTAIIKRAFVVVTNIDVGGVVYPQEELSDAGKANVDRIAPAFTRI